MEVTVIDTGDLPAGTFISFHTGSIRRHAQVEKDKAINLSYASTSEPIRVDLMSQVGSQTFEMVPGQENYDVNIAPGESGGSEVKLRLQIRDSKASEAGGRNRAGAGGGAASSENGDGHSSVSPSRKLQTALMMRSYLDNHDVLRQMQELLQDMVTNRPEDPIEYMINRLEQVCQDNHPVELENKDDEEEEDDEADCGPLDSQAVKKRGRQCSVSAEAYGAFNERRAYQPKIIEKDEKQKRRLQNVLRECWLFKNMPQESLNIIVNAMSEKIVPPDMRLIQQGQDGDVMWVIEQGKLECTKLVEGEDKVVKMCSRGDVFGELALLYNCPRAASVTARDRCVLWELDRETFQAICFEAARGQVSYEGFSAPADTAEDDAADDDDGEELEEELPSPLRPPGRRTGVSAEASKGQDGWVPPVYEKTAEEKAQLAEMIDHSKDSKLHMLFGRVQKATFAKILDAMFSKKVAKGESVIEQGSVGDYFYIVRSGNFDIFVKKGDEEAKKVFEAGAGFAFGELALLYNAPRTATITAREDSEVWGLDRATFRNLVVRSSEAQFKRNVDFLGGVDIFQGLSPQERAAVAEVLEDEEFEHDEAIVEQGEVDDKMFILQSGQAVACIRGNEGEVEVMQYSAGNYFGEIALLLGEPRKASVYAVGHCCCLFIRRDTFIRILGPLTDILSRNIDHYQKYSAAISQAAQDDNLAMDRCLSKESAAGDESQQVTGGKKQVFRKREQKVEDLHNIENHQVDKEVDKDEEPTTLADKVAQDFKNPKLVEPDESFKVAGAQFTAWGGLAPGQKFTNDKALHTRLEKVAKKTDEGSLQDNFTWTMPSKLKCGTEIAVVCQKGQKSEFDPTPNQDNYFVQSIGGVSIYGVCDGHGPFGHLVSFRIVQTLPHFITTSKHFGKDWEATLKEAFVASQAELVKFCAEQNVNIEASGAAGSVLLMEEQTLHIAFIGDARIMVGSWNQRDSRLVFGTTDHKPELPGEKERLEAAGNDVREVAPEHFRVYLKGRDFPGLTMSRTFGDTICKGVLQEPEYHKFLMQPTDEWYALVASDGIWEFIEAEEACSLTAKKLRLKGPAVTLDWLVNASRRRWAHVCGAYCDDITGICVQWNCHSKKETTNNCSLTVKRPE